ncbi:EVE domain-containing protein [Pseudidiomarina salilacus]|uniref:EVE domain-containing protein n=1 Tax=Pseudidiomarina salilacus TaxID=3384452 RepID=UPI003984CBBA
MNYWLMKTEPDECSIDDIANAGAQGVLWDGVRNYQARNFMREMALGDQVLIYHSSCKTIGIAGVAEVFAAAFPDPMQFDSKSPYFDAKASRDKPRWDAVRLRFVAKFSNVISLDVIKKVRALADNPLVKKGNRLSVIPFSAEEFTAVMALNC